MAEFPALPLFTDAIIADTAHLDHAEFGLYMRLLILMWRTPGCNIPNDPVWVAKRLKTDFEHIKPIIDEFCKAENGGQRITQKRLKKEFHYLRDQSKRQAANARKKYEKAPLQKTAEKQGSLNIPLKTNETDGSHSPATLMPPTPPHPTTLKKERIPSGIPKKTSTPTETGKPDDVKPEVWADFLKHRKAKRAPVTQLAMNDITKQAGLAGITLTEAITEICSRGWTGFKAEWYENANRNGNTAGRSLASQAQQPQGRHGQSARDDRDEGTKAIEIGEGIIARRAAARAGATAQAGPAGTGQPHEDFDANLRSLEKVRGEGPSDRDP